MTELSRPKHSGMRKEGDRVEICKQLCQRSSGELDCRVGVC